jgi:transcription termination/antitermination protein NusG
MANDNDEKDDTGEVSDIHDEMSESEEPTINNSEAEGHLSSESGTSEESNATKPDIADAAKPEEIKATYQSKFFAVRTTGGQEHVVANILHNKISSKKIGIHSILVMDNFKGYIIVEAQDSNIAYEALAGIRHMRGQIRGELPFKDIEGYLVKKPIVSDLNIDDIVEVIAGPFKSMKAKITRVDHEKQEATVVLLDSPYQIPVTVDANFLKKSLH